MKSNILKKILRDYTYLTESLTDIKSISSEAEIEFRNALREEDSDAVKALLNPNVKKDENEVDENSNQDESDPSYGDKDFKKLFRKVVVKCHPDKLDNDIPHNIKEYYKEQYELATKANDTYDWGLLIMVAINLDIEIQDIDENQLKNIENRIEELKIEISKYENSMAYQWFNIKDETLKNKYLVECAKVFKMSTNNSK